MATSSAIERLIAEWRAFLHQHQINQLIIGYSGGLDSHVLLHLLASHFHDLSLQAIYVDHQQSLHAKHWQAHTQAVCEQLGVAYQSVAIRGQQKAGESLEAFLREQRYAIFKQKICDDKTALMVAHHADDQAETVLLRLLRGAGPVGLAAMQPSQRFDKGWLLRPLLTLSKSELELYARQHQLQWVEDESNQDQRFDRNYVRQTVMPLLKQRWPGLHKTLPRTASLCQESQVLLEEVAVADGATNTNPLNWQPLRSLSLPRQANALRSWLFGLGVLSPSQAQLKAFLHQLATAASDKVPALFLSLGVIRYYRSQLYYCQQKTERPIPSLLWDLREELIIGNGRLTVKRVQGQGLSAAKISLPLRVTSRAGGEVIQLGRSQCHQRLKNCWQQWGIPPWQRVSYPLLYQDATLVAVPGLAVGNEWAAAPDETGLVVEWKADRRAS